MSPFILVAAGVLGNVLNCSEHLLQMCICSFFFKLITIKIVNKILTCFRDGIPVHHKYQF